MARMCLMMLGVALLSSARAYDIHQSNTSSNTTTRTVVQFEALDYVLPKTSLPISYDLFLDLTDDHFLAYSGMVEVRFKQLANSSVFAINSAGLSIDEGTLRLVRSDMSHVPIAGFEIQHELQIVFISFSEQLILDEVYTAHLEFEGDINVDFFKGLYRSSYKTEYGEKYIATTFFAATYARTVFPCYDEPEYKASFLIKIRHGVKYTALSNMPESQRDESDAFVETTFQPTPLMSTYLLAFVVSELKTVSSQDELFRVYAPEGREHQTAYAHSIAARALRALENYFGRQNQMPKIDLVAIPDFAMGAMENWGLITFREDYLLYQPGETTAQAQQSIAAVITHELAHMWFGNEVTPEWWTYVWLNEGFARYFEYYITSQLEPSWTFWEQFIVTNVHSALAQDCHSNNRAMSYYSSELSIVNELYDYVVYAKSASVIRMIQNVIGFDNFRPALNDYLRSRSYLTTNPQYLYESIEKFRTVDLPASVEKIFESWANAPGYPLVTVTIDWNQRTLKASQKRFWMPNDLDTPPKNELFYVPLNYGFNGMSAEDKENTAPSFWLTPDQPEVSVNIDSNIDVIFMNKQQTGYYRVNYDKESWNQLIKTLNDDKFDEHIPVINRAQLVDDVANLARAGLVDYSVALSLMQYLERETEYIPWSTAYNALLHLDRLFSSNSEYERFESYVRNLTTLVYHKTQLQGKLDHLSLLHREKALYLACYFGVTPCLAETDSVLQVALGNDSLYIPKDLQPTIFCAFNKHKSLSGTQYEAVLFSKFFQHPAEFLILNGAPRSSVEIGPPWYDENYNDPSNRLGNQSEPISYKLELDVTSYDFYSYTGTVDILVRFNRPSDSFHLNIAGPVIDKESISVTGPEGSNRTLIETIEQYDVEKIMFVFAEGSFVPDSTYRVRMSFSNSIGTELKGLYRSSYKVGNMTRYLATTHFEATYARTVFPCYDEPSFKATYDVQIRHRTEYNAISNMPVIEKTQVGDYTVTRFDTTPLMSSYLLAFVISDFETISQESDRFRVFAVAHKVAHTGYALDFLGKSMRTLENFFGHQYQLPKADLIAIPDFAMGAMENWGLITFREQYLIYEEGVTTARTKQNIGDLITHELTHMWFGNEVTPEWWTYLWLSEGFARYFEYYITSQLEPTWNLWEQFIVTNVHSALGQDCQSNNRPMSYDATRPSLLNNLFDYVVYAKSASVIRMIQNVIGFDNFRPALNDYLRSRSYLTTNPQYLYESIEKFRTVDLPASVEKIFESWANAPGYPLVTVTIDWNQRTLKASQKRFWMPNDLDTPPKNELFYVPLNYGFNGMSAEDKENTAPSFWLTPDQPEVSVNIDSNIDVIFMNKQQTGYYRVNYDKESWNQLIKTLNDDKFDEHIPVINRAQLVDDVANLARAGLVDYSVALSLMQYLERETEYIPWSTAYNALLHLDRMYAGYEGYPRFETYVRTLTSCMYENVRLVGSVDHINRLHRGNTVYLACYSGATTCLHDASTLINKTIDDPSFVIPEETQAAVFCALHKHGLSVTVNDTIAWFEGQFLAESVDLDMINRYITSVGCSRNEKILHYYLSLTNQNEPSLPITIATRNQIYLALIGGSSTARTAALNYLYEHYYTVAYLIPDMLPIIAELGNRINKRSDYELLVQIKEKYRGTMLATIVEAIEGAKQKAEQNIAWIESYSSSVNSWLIDEMYEGTTQEPPGDGGSARVWGSLTLPTVLFGLIIGKIMNYL
ncbi:aminopeptidase N-like [Anopheles darlingi]|uniref:aminopeptidase N-like n=1 Tax=Anopheles darlingi TaxID=43151 RepID=UPI0021004970|nr:aminopeptidase N-like [Anopheles darlingi]